MPEGLGVKLLGPTGIIVVVTYLMMLLAIGWWGRRARQDNSLSDYYLGNRGLGFLVLLMTLYATQYSGNTMIGFAAASYRQGWQFLMALGFMMAVVGCYFVFAPKLHRLSRREGFITPSDFVAWRFRHRGLTVAVTLIFIVTLANYVLTNLKAVMEVIETGSGGAYTGELAVIGLAVLMLIYQTLGGMRSVAWTDVLQGLILLVGIVTIFIAMEVAYGGLTTTLGSLRTADYDLWSPPAGAEKVRWFSTLVLIFFGIAIYPHAIQRIYAARDSQTLKRSLQVMVFMPLVTTLLMITVGVVGAVRFPGLSRDDSEAITLLVLQDIAMQIPALKFLLTVFLAAVLAAIMSTIDSALLSLSSMFTQDFYRHWRPHLSQAQLTLAGKFFGAGVMALMVGGAIALPSTIWALIQIKIELLVQAAPAMLLGLHVPRLRAGSILAGLIAGTALTLGLLLAANFTGESFFSRPFNLHAGLWGLMLNLVTVAVAHKLEVRVFARRASA
ncbi:MAG: sodium:solute symporter family protein [Verrucomicrobiota bacterium]